MKKPLSSNEEDILSRIVGYGGYVTKEILALYKKDLTLDGCYRILSRLENKGYLKQIPYFEAYRQPAVYQVTYKACKHYGRAQAHMRKKHKTYAIRRYLIRAHYLFHLAGNDFHIKYFSSEERIEALKEEGYSNYHIPKKYNKEDAVLQVEEYILNIDKENGIGNIVFLYIDNQAFQIDVQIKTLLSKYAKMNVAAIRKVCFVVATENRVRAEMFEDIFNLEYARYFQMFELKAVSIDRKYAAFQQK